jgi:enamine deaminase RidA (YjgF/YER057c/UK114 family)
MPVTLINPEGLPDVDVYRQVAIASGSRSVFIAGQVARDADGNPVAPGDLAGQVTQAYRNIAVALAAADASFSDVVRLTIYVVDWTIDKMPDLLEGIANASAELDIAPAAPVTLIGVAALFESDVLVEIEATAVADQH